MPISPILVIDRMIIYDTLLEPFDPFSIIFTIMFIIPLVISIILFVKYPSWRRDMLYCLGILGGFELVIFYLLGDVGWVRGWIRVSGLLLGFATLTCFGVMATLYITKKRRYRILGGVVFLILGCLLLIWSIFIFSRVLLFFWLRFILPRYNSFGR